MAGAWALNTTCGFESLTMNDCLLHLVQACRRDLVGASFNKVATSLCTCGSHRNGRKSKRILRLDVIPLQVEPGDEPVVVGRVCSCWMIWIVLYPIPPKTMATTEQELVQVGMEVLTPSSKCLSLS